jgi:alpha-glucosidase (family GH31 glycosyl hydrolase)
MLTALAREAADTGMPMWRGLALHYPEDAAVWPIKDQILLGRSLMISPVIVEGATNRPIYFPEGRWFDWNGDGAVDGPVNQTVDSGMEEIAVFARAGGIVPMYPDGVMTLVRGSAEVPDTSLVGDDRIVRVFLGDSGNIVEDSGLAYELTALAELGDSLSLEFEGEGAASVSLSKCDSELTAPCVETSGRELVAHVVGAGKFTVLSGQTASAEFVVSGGDPARVMTVRFRN